MNSDWESLLAGLGIISVLVFVCSAAAAPFLVSRIPEDYFIRTGAERTVRRAPRPLVYWPLRIGRNLFGALLLTGGMVMLFVPGQGILTMLAGLTLLDFPGKRGLERALIRRKPVSRSLNWLRRRRGVPPLRIP